VDYVEPFHPSHRLVWCGRLLLVVCGISGLILGLRPEEHVPVPPTTTTLTTEAPVLRLTSTGYGPVTIGMAWSWATLAGMEVVQDAAGCQIGRFFDLTVYGKDGTVTALIAQDEGVRTLRGIGVGSSRFEVASLYPTATGEGDRLTVMEGQHRLVFGFRDDLVVYISAEGIDGAGC
jgi:sporulation protein YlmC with PRC-barrel domain